MCTFPDGTHATSLGRKLPTRGFTIRCGCVSWKLHHGMPLLTHKIGHLQMWQMFSSAVHALTQVLHQLVDFLVKRRVTFAIVLSLGLVGSLWAADPFVGHFKLNLAESKLPSSPLSN
jgi:hypothetical protein